MEEDDAKEVDIEIEIEDELYEWAESRSKELGYDKVEDYLRDVIIEQLEIEERNRSQEK